MPSTSKEAFMRHVLVLPLVAVLCAASATAQDFDPDDLATE